MVALLFTCVGAQADRLVFGAFRSVENATNWAQKLTVSLGQPMSVRAVQREGQQLHRVQSENLSADALATLSRRARSAGIAFWRLTDQGENLSRADVPGSSSVRAPGTSPRLTPPSRVSDPAPQPDVPVQAEPEAAEAAETAETGAPPAPPPPAVSADATRSQQARNDRTELLEFEVGLQGRYFSDKGFDGQDRYVVSLSLEPEYYTAWDGDRQSVTFKPFLRLDSEDARRSHADVRELFYTYVGGNWDLHIGAKRVFWGVTEFNHLVDIVNQTDLVENIDTEDKLGQPMVQWSTVQDWGILDVYWLLGHRERTFPGRDGRLRTPLRVRGDALYESGAEELRSDFAMRWSHHVGAFEFGLHHFSGTSRDPLFVPQLRGSEIVLNAFYPVIDQTGLDAQAIYGDWALKVEAMTRSGFGERYAAFNLGVERTLVGVFGTTADLGLVGEYMFDERDDEAFNTLFENDIALGGRLALNDFADTQALLGVIFDTERSEYAVSLEASRRLSDVWHLEIESRIFNGGRSLRDSNQLLIFTDPDYKSAWLQSEDYLQIEVKRFF